MVLSQDLRRSSEVLELEVRLLQRDLMVLAGRKAAVGIETEPIGRQIGQSLLDALGDALGRLDLGETHIDAAQADLEAGGQLTQDGHVARHRNAEFKHQLLYAQALE